MATVPLAVFWAATAELDKVKSDPEKQAFLRRVALISLNGGIPVDLLGTKSWFKFKKDHFETLGLPLCNPAYIDKEPFEIERIESNFKFLKEELAKAVDFSEGSLRTLFWDEFLKEWFKESNAPWAVRSELVLDELLKLDNSRRADFAVVSTKFKIPCFIAEIGEEVINSNVVHKDFGKMSSLLTISCLRLAEQLRDAEFDPRLARSFGLLVGGTGSQMLTAHPVFTETQKEQGTQKAKYDIHAIVSVNKDWFLEFGDEYAMDVDCEGDCCMKADLAPIPAVSDAPPFDFEKNLALLGSVIFEQQESSVASPSAVTTGSVSEQEETMTETKNYMVNRIAVTKTSIFMNIVKDYMRNLDKLGPKDKVDNIDFDPPNIAFVQGATSGTAGITPAKNRFQGVDNSALNALKSNLTDKFSITKSSVTEMEIYKKHLRDYFVFPIVYSAQRNKYDNSQIDYEFEKMFPILDNGIFGAFGEGHCYSPVVRADRTLSLILDASTLAVHVLYGLDILHKRLGLVHSDISHQNILFSLKDDVWKINDFDSAMSIEESFKTERKTGTNYFIAPEALKTGIFTEECDIYSLGRVLWWIFYIQIMWLYESTDRDEITDSAHNDFFEATTAMISESPSERPKVLDCLKAFHKIIKTYAEEDFEIYGCERLMVAVQHLLDTEASIEKEAEIPLEPIVTNV